MSFRNPIVRAFTTNKLIPQEYKANCSPSSSFQWCRLPKWVIRTSVIQFAFDKTYQPSPYHYSSLLCQRYCDTIFLWFSFWSKQDQPWYGARMCWLCHWPWRPSRHPEPQHTPPPSALPSRIPGRKTKEECRGPGWIHAAIHRIVVGIKVTIYAAKYYWPSTCQPLHILSIICPEIFTLTSHAPFWV